MKSINAGGKLLSLDRARIMGVINITPDSFYADSRLQDPEKILSRIQDMLDQGADIIDLGAFSSRPGAKMISVEEELARLIPAVELISSHFDDLVISLDTYRYEVLKRVVDIKACIVNDITGFDKDPEILSVVKANNLPYVLMHMQGTPQSMQTEPKYDDVCFDVLDFMARKLHELRSKGVDQVIVDPGFGFGKTIEHNYQLLKNLEAFKIFGKALMIGISRKSMIYKLLGTDPQNALNGTTVAHTVALLNGADILRVHDVKEASECVRICNTLNNSVKKNINS